MSNARGPYAASARSPKAIRRRITLIEQVRSIPRAEIDRALSWSDTTIANCESPVVKFCDKHRISIDWLILGDLRGLRRTRLGIG